MYEMHNNCQSKERTFGRPLRNTSVLPKEQVLMLVKNPKPIISLNILRIFHKQSNVHQLTLHILCPEAVVRIYRAFLQ